MALPRDRTLLLRRDRAAASVLRALFPFLAQLRFELQFDGPTENVPVPQTHVLHPAARAYFVFPCPYADCDGQFDLAAAVSAALEASALRAEGLLECAGLRADVHASKRPCGLHLHYTITATRAPTP